MRYEPGGVALIPTRHEPEGIPRIPTGYGPGGVWLIIILMVTQMTEARIGTVQQAREVLARLTRPSSRSAMRTCSAMYGPGLVSHDTLCRHLCPIARRTQARDDSSLASIPMAYCVNTDPRATTCRFAVKPCSTIIVRQMNGSLRKTLDWKPRMKS